MRSTKIRIIQKEGVNVQVERYATKNLINTKALLGRGAKTNANMKLLEGQKEGIFLPDLQIDSGDFVHNKTHSEIYVVSGTHQEYYRDTALSIVANLLKCNNTLTVKGNQTVADNRGNLKTVFTVTYDGVPCHLQIVTNALRQYEPGIHPDTEYRIYTTSLDVKETDKVSIKVRGKDEEFKVLAKDYITYPMMLVLDVSRDIRK